MKILDETYEVFHQKDGCKMLQGLKIRMRPPMFRVTKDLRHSGEHIKQDEEHTFLSSDESSLGRAWPGGYFLPG